MFCEKSCSQKFRNIHGKTPVFESLFNKVADLKACNFIKKRLQYRCFPVNIGKLLRTPVLKKNMRIILTIHDQSQQTFTCSKSTIDAVKKGVKYVHS